jgi:hypothetical protein
MQVMTSCQPFLLKKQITVIFRLIMLIHKEFDFVDGTLGKVSHSLSITDSRKICDISCRGHVIVKLLYITFTFLILMKVDIQTTWVQQ